MNKAEPLERLVARLKAAQALGAEEERVVAAELRRRFPDAPEGYRAGVAAAYALGDFAAALETAQQAEARFPGQPWPLSQRAGLALTFGRLDEAIGLCEALRSRFPNDEAGFGVGVAALRGRNRLTEAAKVAETAARRFAERPQYREQARELRVLVNSQARALTLSSRLVEAWPAFARARVVMVLGMHRSGSSLLAQTVGALGIGLGGPLMQANYANSDGYFEHLEVVNAHDAALRAMGVSWDVCWSALAKPPRLTSAARAEARARLEAIVERELQANGGAWALKDPRALRFLPLWLEIFESLGVEPVWILCVRDPRAVASSLYARDRIPPAISELLWIEHVIEALAHLGPQLRLIAPYERWFAAPKAQLRALARAVGRSPKGVAIPARAGLRHHAPTDEAATLPLAQEIAAALAAPAPDLADLQARARSLQRRLRRWGLAPP